MHPWRVPASSSSHDAHACRRTCTFRRDILICCACVVVHEALSRAFNVFIFWRSKRAYKINIVCAHARARLCVLCLAGLAVAKTTRKVYNARAAARFVACSSSSPLSSSPLSLSLARHEMPHVATLCSCRRVNVHVYGVEFLCVWQCVLSGGGLKLSHRCCTIRACPLRDRGTFSLSRCCCCVGIRDDSILHMCVSLRP